MQIQSRVVPAGTTLCSLSTELFNSIKTGVICLPLHPKLEVQIEAVEENTVTATTSYWSDPMRAMEIAPPVGTDVYIFEDGKIVSQTWTLTIADRASKGNEHSPTDGPAPHSGVETTGRM